MAHHIPDVNADQHNLAEIAEAKKQISGAMAAENNPAGANNQGGGVIPRVQNAGVSLQSGGVVSGSGGHNHASVYGDVAVSKITGGAPSIELAGMGLKVLSEGFGVTKSIKDGFKGKKLGYGTGGAAKASSIQTGPESPKAMLAFKAANTSNSITSPSNGVAASKAGAPQMGGVKLALQQKLGQTLQAEHGVHRQIHQANQMGGARAPALVASLQGGMKPPNFNKPEEAPQKSIWDSDTA